MLGCCQFRLKTIRESDFSYRSATEKFLLPLWRDFLCTLPSGYWHMCENLLTEFFSSLFRDICIKTYWLCPSSFACRDICTETYRLCPSSFARWDIYMKTYSPMSLFFCFPGHICQKKRYMSHCRKHKGHNAKECFYMSHCAKRVGHNRANIFYMSPNEKITPFSSVAIQNHDN